MKVSGAYNAVLDYCMVKNIQNVFFVSQKNESHVAFELLTFFCEIPIAAIAQIKYSVSMH